MAGVAQLLSAALSSDNNVRRNAEQQLGQHLRSNPEKLLTAVLVQLRSTLHVPSQRHARHRRRSHATMAYFSTCTRRAVHSTGNR